MDWTRPERRATCGTLWWRVGLCGGGFRFDGVRSQSFDYGKATYAGAAGMFFWTPCASATSTQPGTSEVTICGGQARGVTVDMPLAGMTAVAVIINGDGAALAAQPVIAAFTNHTTHSAQVSVTGTAASVIATLRTDPISAVCTPASLLYSAPSSTKASAQLTDRSVITLTNCAGSLDALVAAGKVLKVISGVQTWLSFTHDAYNTVSNVQQYRSSPALQACTTGRMLSYIADVLIPVGVPTCTPSTLPAWTGTLSAGQTARFAVTPILEEHFTGSGQGEAVMFSFIHLHVMACPSRGSCQAGTQLVTASLPVVSCPTSLGIPRPAVALPRSRPVAVPQALAADLSVYADNQGVMELLGPKGWSCTAAIGADGSGGVTVYPTGAGPSSPVAIVGSETSACVGCTLAQACPLFSSAVKALRSDLGQACPAHPAAETVASIAAGIVSFEDPPGVKGDGRPSGGQYPANGVMTYHPSSQDGSWQETCTLPANEKDICTAVLNTFVSWYGQR